MKWGSLDHTRNGVRLPVGLLSVFIRKILISVTTLKGQAKKRRGRSDHLISVVIYLFVNSLLVCLLSVVSRFSHKIVLFDPYEWHMNLCNQFCSLSFLYGKNVLPFFCCFKHVIICCFMSLSVALTLAKGHTLRIKRFVGSATIDLYHFMPFSVALTLAEGHKIRIKQSLLASFSRTLLSSSGFNLMCWNKSRWIPWYYFRVRFVFKKNVVLQIQSKNFTGSMHSDVYVLSWF